MAFRNLKNRVREMPENSENRSITKNSGKPGKPKNSMVAGKFRKLENSRKPEHPKTEKLRETWNSDTQRNPGKPKNPENREIQKSPESGKPGIRKIPLIRKSVDYGSIQNVFFTDKNYFNTRPKLIKYWSKSIIK